MAHEPAGSTQPVAYLTCGDVAKIAGVVPATVKTWVAAGRLRVAATTITGRRLFRQEDVDACLAQRQQAKAVEAA